MRASSHRASCQKPSRLWAWPQLSWADMLHLVQTSTLPIRAECDGSDNPSAADIVPALTALFEAGTAAIVLLDLRNDGFERVNARFCELLNYDAATLMKMRLRDVLHPEDIAAVGRDFRRALLARGRWEGEIRQCAPTAPSSG